METVLVGVFALMTGVAVGLATATWRKQGPDRSILVLQEQAEKQFSELRRIADAQASRAGGEDRLKAGIEGARRAVEELRVRDEERRGREVEHMDVVRRLSTVLSGGTAKGRAGENVLQEYFADFPPDMLLNDFRVNGKVVEFGLKLPDGRCLPVDSKWSAIAELEALEATDDPAERSRLAVGMEREVARRAKEVSQYLDPSLTAPVALAAVPDPVYEVLRKAHGEAYRRGVVIVPYSMALPVLLFLYSLVSRYGRAGDVQACLGEIGAVLEGIEQIVETRLTRATTMLQNGNDELRAHVGKARGSIARAGVAPPSFGATEASALRAVE
jgi:DNA recombination protein RmuC